MAKQKPLEIIHAPNTLKVKVGGTTDGPSKDAVKRAEQALAELEGEMQGWLEDELERFCSVHSAYTDQPQSLEAREEFYRCTHDLKGLGATYGFPLVGRIAGSLCLLMITLEQDAGLPTALINAHVEAVKVIVRDNVRDAEDPTGNILAGELETQVDKAIA